jgi:hypothetical protein
VTHPLSTVSVITSAFEANGMMTLDELLGDRIEDHLHVPLHHLFGDLHRHDQPNISTKSLLDRRAGRP